MRNILILTDGHLPVPAVQGGAVPTLVESIIKINEIENQFRINIISLYTKEAEISSKKYKSTNFLYIKKKIYISILDIIANKFFRLFMTSQNKRDIDIFWKMMILLYSRKMLKYNNFDYVILENHGFLTKVFNNKQLIIKYKDKIYYHLHNEIPDSVSKKIEPNLKYILISEYLKNGIIEKFGKEVLSRISIIKNGIDVSSANLTLSQTEKTFLRKKYGINKEDFVVIFVGRIAKEKGIKEVLEAFEIISEKNIKLFIAGGTEFANNIKSSFENEIKEKCKRLKNKVIFSGYIDHSQIWKYYQMSNVALLPSMWEEPAGLTIIEAMCNGVPVITTNAGGIPEYFDEAYGIILKRGSHIVNDIVNSVYDFYLNKIKIDTDSEKKHILNSFSELKYYNDFVKLLK